MQFTATLRTNRAQQIATTVGVGGTVKFWTGTGPGVSNTATGTPLSTLAALTFGTASAGAITFSATADPSAANSGTPGYGRLLTSGATAVVEFTAGVSSGEASFNNAISLGGTVTLSSATITEGNP